MRWKKEAPPKHGDIRVIRRFLFLPRTINNERRWLEFAHIYQRWDDGQWCWIPAMPIWIDFQWADGPITQWREHYGPKPGNVACA